MPLHDVSQADMLRSPFLQQPWWDGVGGPAQRLGEHRSLGKRVQRGPLPAASLRRFGETSITRGQGF